MRSGKVAADIDAYIAAAPADVRDRLTKIRAIIAKAAPDATEVISYGMPTFRLHGILLHFAAFKHHISIFPGPTVIASHAIELAGYVTSKGTIQLPLDRPLPVALIRAITKHRVQESITRAAAKQAARTLTPTTAPATKRTTTSATVRPVAKKSAAGRSTPRP